MSRQYKKTLGVFSQGMLGMPFLSPLLDANIVRASAAGLRKLSLSALAGWGRRPSGVKAQQRATSLGLPFIAVEDGFLRSYGTGAGAPALSLVADERGIYYDSTCASALEDLLNSPDDLLAGLADDVARARTLVVHTHRLSKYNHAPLLAPDVLAPGSQRRVLVIDQTVGDMSVVLGAATAATFFAMLAAARADHPGAMIYVKSHPEVSAGSKRGYLSAVADDAGTRVLRQPVNPLSLIEQVDAVYVVTSGMGFEAVLAGKPVTVFGMPWYAGWGLTHDRQQLARRMRQRSADELFAAAYFHYPRYLNPQTREPGSIFHVVDWLARQRQFKDLYPGRMIGIGFRRWKAANLRPMLSLDPHLVQFVADATAAAALAPGRDDCLLFWGAVAPPGVAELAQRSGARLVRMEDGFVRSVGLGSDLIRPLSLVLDDGGIYFDARQASGLERLLATADFSATELARAAWVRAFMVEHGITKYNLERRAAARWPSAGKTVVLVPGQVEDDASIRFGCVQVRTNLALLQAARAAQPDAYVVYKPHPDVSSGNRAGRLAHAEALRYADLVETDLSVVSCIDACDVVYTMTSLAGFDALLRGKHVVVHGQPFYAGWGLTHDVASAVETPGADALARRTRRLTLDQLVAGVLLRYPLYWDWELKGYTTCEAVLQRLVEQRDALEAHGGLEKLRLGMLRRQWRKLGILGKTWWSERKAA